MYDLVYDIESYPNLFLLGVKNTANGKKRYFECSERRNDFPALCHFIESAGKARCRMIGFRNWFYDYPLLHFLIENNESAELKSGQGVANAAFEKTTEIIEEGSFDNQWEHCLYENRHLVKQIDLFRVHHFDNVAKATSLKMLEFNMRSDSIQELPYPPGTWLTHDQMDHVIRYNGHDLDQTHKFLNESAREIKFREELSVKYGRDFINHNDTKIGKEHFLHELRKTGIKTHYFDEKRKRQPIQTRRASIKPDEIIFPFIEFERPEFNAVLDWLRRQTITNTKGAFTRLDPDGLGDLANYCDLKKEVGMIKNLNCVVDGFKVVFGTGGIHGSIEPNIASQSNSTMIKDLDVTSYYPSIAIEHGLFPEHLTRAFVGIYAGLKLDRVHFVKGTPENKMLKLALNGVFGDTNNRYSPFFDPKYTMAITINGQLMLCMLAEKLMAVDGLELLQMNTDGLTVKMNVWDEDRVQKICDEWSALTRMDLEEALYSDMFIRDVNNYIGLYTDGEVKRKGAFEYELEWHKNHSCLVVQRAVEAYLIKGVPVERFIKNHDDVFDFMLRTKIPRTSKLTIEYGENGLMPDEELQRVTRYFVSNKGGTLIKTMPPLPKKPEKWRRISVQKGWLVTPMNEMGPVEDLNFDYYIEQANKLISPLMKGARESLY